MEINKVEAMSPLTWAYVGDSIYEAYIRTYLVETTNLKPHKLHIKAINFVKAKAQAEILQKIHDDFVHSLLFLLFLVLFLLIYHVFFVKFLLV